MYMHIAHMHVLCIPVSMHTAPRAYTNTKHAGTHTVKKCRQAHALACTHTHRHELVLASILACMHLCARAPAHARAQALPARPAAGKEPLYQVRPEHMCTQTRVHMRMCMRAHVCKHFCVWHVCMHACMRTCTCAHLPICVCTCACACMCVLTHDLCTVYVLHLMSRCVRHMYARECVSATSASTWARAVLVCMPSARGLIPPPRQDSCMQCERAHTRMPARTHVRRYAPVAKAGYYGVRWATAKDVAYTFHACAPGRCLQASGSVWAVLTHTKYTTFT